MSGTVIKLFTILSLAALLAVCVVPGSDAASTYSFTVEADGGTGSSGDPFVGDATITLSIPDGAVSSAIPQKTFYVERGNSITFDAEGSRTQFVNAVIGSSSPVPGADFTDEDLVIPDTTFDSSVTGFYVVYEYDKMSGMSTQTMNGYIQIYLTDGSGSGSGGEGGEGGDDSGSGDGESSGSGGSEGNDDPLDDGDEIDENNDQSAVSDRQYSPVPALIICVVLFIGVLYLIRKVKR